MLQRIDRYWRLVGVAMLSGIVIGASIYTYRQRQEDHRIDAMIPQMQSADPIVRLNAAEQVLRVDRGRRDARFIKAEAILDLHRDEDREEARAILHSLIKDAAFTPNTSAKLELIDSYLNEAAEAVAGTIPAGAEHARRQIEETLLTHATELRGQLDEAEVGKGTIVLLHAREIDVQAGIQRVLLRRKQLEAAQATSASQVDLRRQLDIEMSRLRVRIRDLDRELVALCSQAAALKPDDAGHDVLMFRMYLRQGQVDKAREVAANAAKRDVLDGSTAGELAGALLDLERIQAVQPTAGDIALARALLMHPNLVRTDELKGQLALGSLAIQEDRPADAEAISTKLLERYDAHPRAMLLLTLAMLRQGRGSEAMELLSPYNERVRTADGRMAMGLALLERNNRSQGRDYLRQSLQISPNNLPARLALIESYISAGEATAVEAEVRIAHELAPAHPGVRRYRAIVLSEKRDRTELGRIVRERAYGGGMVVRPEDCAMAVQLLLGEPRVDALIAERLAAEPGDSVGLVANAARHMTPEVRIDVTVVLVRELIDLLDASPMSQPVGPDAETIYIGVPSSQTGQAPHATNPLEGSRFMPWAFEDGYRLALLASERWPDDLTLHDLAMRCAFWLGDDAAARQHLGALVSAGAELSLPAIAIDAWYRKRFDDPSVREQLLDASASIARAGATVQFVLLCDAVRKRDPKLVGETLESMIASHPWAEPAVTMVLADMLRRGDSIGAEHWLTLVGRLSPRMETLCRARYLLATGRPAEAIRIVEEVLRTEPAESHVREQGTDIIARANLSLEHNELAAGSLDRLTAFEPDRTIPIRIMVADAHLSSGRRSAASLTLGTLLTDAKMTPRGLDRALQRAERVIASPQLIALLELQLGYRPEEPVLLVYLARQHLMADQLEAAAIAVASLQRIAPQAARTRATELLLADAAGNVDESQRLKAILGPDATARVMDDWSVTREAATLVVALPGGDE